MLQHWKLLVFMYQLESILAILNILQMLLILYIVHPLA